jgi:hypothetical protein
MSKQNIIRLAGSNFVILPTLFYNKYLNLCRNAASMLNAERIK